MSNNKTIKARRFIINNHLYLHRKTEVHRLRNAYLDSHSAPVRPVICIEANESHLTLGKNALIVAGVISRSLNESIMSPGEHSELPSIS